MATAGTEAGGTHSERALLGIYLNDHLALPADPHMPRRQAVRPGPLHQGHHRYQARPRHEIRVINDA